MVYKIAISLPDYIYELYIKDFTGNRSELIAGLILQGAAYNKNKRLPSQDILLNKLQAKIKEQEALIKQLKFKLIERNKSKEQNKYRWIQ